MPLTPEQRILRARIGGYARAAKHDSREMIVPALQGFEARFYRQVDPNNQLPPAERARRAEAAKRAYMTGLALKSARARGKRRGVATGEPESDHVAGDVGGDDAA